MGIDKQSAKVPKSVMLTLDEAENLYDVMCSVADEVKEIDEINQAIALLQSKLAQERTEEK